MPTLSRFAAVLALAATTSLSACSRHQPPAAAGDQFASDQPLDAGPTGGQTALPTECEAVPAAPMMSAQPAAEWTVLRVAGEEAGEVEFKDRVFRFRGMMIDTPLPVGYPGPTPPGAIELKKYPSVRRAEVSGQMHPDVGMNLSFWPLFNHIKRRDIAMTSPVEMDYAGKGAGAGQAPDGWTMSFLYREPANGDLGQDRQVKIVDTQPMTVLAIGLRGRYSWEKLQEPLDQLGQWLAQHPEWERAGDARALYYNGPDRRTADRWAELQIPVRRAGLSPTQSTSPAQP